MLDGEDSPVLPFSFGFDNIGVPVVLQKRHACVTVAGEVEWAHFLSRQAYHFYLLPGQL
jgi:hypothetical protein